MSVLNDRQREEAQKLFQQGYAANDVFRHLGAHAGGKPSVIDDRAAASKSLAQKQTPGFLRAIGDIPDDIMSGVKNLGEDYLIRYDNMKQAAGASLRGEQGVGETALQLTGQLAGGLGDAAFRAVQTVGSLPLTPETETAIGEKVGNTVNAIDNKTGISEWFNTLDEKTQRNVQGALGWGEAASFGVGKSITGNFIDKLKGTPKATPLQLSAPKDMIYVADEAATGNIAPAIKATNATLDEIARTKIVNDFTEAYRSSLVENRMSISNKLEDVAKDASRGGEKVTRDSLLRNLAQEGYVPEIEGRLAKFDSSFNDLKARQTEVMEKLDSILETSSSVAKIDDLYEMSRKALAENPQIVGGLARSQAELERLFSSYRQKFGDTLTAKQVNQIRKESNELTKAFKDTDKFSADTASELGKVTRKWLDENVPDNTVRAANAEWARLNRLDVTMQILNNQQVDVGMLGRALGSYVTTVAGATAGIAVGGPGGLVIAGLLAKIGGDKMADMIRQRIFNPETASKIREVMQSNRSLLKKLEETATTQANKKAINDLAGFNVGEQKQLPAPSSNTRSSVTSGAPLEVGGQTPAGRVEPGITERSQPGAIKQPGGEGQPLSRSAYPELGEAELQNLKTASFRKMLNDAGVSPEEVQKAIAGGTVGAMLLLYLNEDGSMLPAFGAMMGVATTSVGRRTMLDEALKTNNMRREALMKAGKTDTSPEIKALEKQNTSLAKEKAALER